MTSLLPGCKWNWNLIFRLGAVMFESGIEFKSIIIFNLIMTLTIWIRSFFLMPLTWVQSEIPPFYISPFFRQTLNSMPDAKSKEVQRKESMTAGKGVVRTNYQLRKSRSMRILSKPTDPDGEIQNCGETFFKVESRISVTFKL